MKIIITSADGLVAATAAANEGVIFVQRIIDRFHGKMTVLIMCAVLLAGLLAGCGARAGSSGELDASGAGGNNAAAGQGGASNGQEGAGGAAAGEGGAKSGAGAASYPLTIKHAKGETVIREKPKSVAITYFPYADHLLAIGEMPEKLGVVGLSSLKNFPVYDPFTKDGRIIDLGNTANLEKVLEMSPECDHRLGGRRQDIRAAGENRRYDCHSFLGELAGYDHPGCCRYGAGGRGPGLYRPV